VSRAAIRVGQGYDVHPFRSGRRLVLGGVEIPSARGGLGGHSDADVLAHAVASALLGSLALGDLGTHFPESDRRWEAASSLEILRAAAALVHGRGWSVVNCDATVVAQEPRLAPHIAAMRANLAAALEIAPEDVSVKATTHEGLGALGRAEGIAAQAVVLVTRTRG
jgi:2-C-methyl-D-erythritol 2,4-cyclodiphosphate synthase